MVDTDTNSKYMKRLSMMMLICIKKACSQVRMFSIVGHAYMYDKHYIPCLKNKNIKCKLQTYRINKFITKKIMEIDFSYGRKFS